jgi:hypothetical protein
MTMMEDALKLRSLEDHMRVRDFVGIDRGVDRRLKEVVHFESTALR